MTGTVTFQEEQPAAGAWPAVPCFVISAGRGYSYQIFKDVGGRITIGTSPSTGDTEVCSLQELYDALMIVKDKRNA